MNWLFLTILSAVLLGIYDVLKKLSVRENAVPVVLLASVSCGAMVWLPMTIWSSAFGVSFGPEAIHVLRLSAIEHALVFAKSLLVGASWSFAFAALKHLPLSIGGPIRSTSPLWTIFLAVVFLGERPSFIQWVGIVVVVASFIAFSVVGRREGIHFHRDRWVFCMIAATILGSISSIYDKYLLQTCQLHVPTMQAWFSIYLVPVMCPLAISWFVRDRKRVPFKWKWTIPLIAFSLLAADYLYFTAVQQPGALISVISPIRRTAVLIPLLLGVRIFGEANLVAKVICVVGLLFGVALLARGS